MLFFVFLDALKERFMRYSILKFTSLVFSLLIGGCGINGTYQDVAGPDAAKLRFIADTRNSTLDIFDAESCDGRTTGLLNNLLVPNTRRRVDMNVEPPVGKTSYLEIKIKPEHDYFLRANTLGSYSVCTVEFNFMARRNTEYELHFDFQSRRCRVSMTRLERVDGQVVRTPVGIAKTGLDACRGRSPIFP